MNIESIQQQVNGQVKWNATEPEMRDWLSNKHSIAGELADSIIQQAFQAKSAEIRSTAKVHFIVYSLVTIVLASLGLLGEMVDKSILASIMWVAAIGSLVLILRSLRRLISGKGDHRSDFAD